MLANSLGFVMLTVAWAMLAGNGDRVAEFQSQLVTVLRRVKQPAYDSIMQIDDFVRYRGHAFDRESRQRGVPPL